MPSRTSETILNALKSALETAAPSGTVVWRNRTVPTMIPAAGLIVLRDGNPGEPEVTLSPPVWSWEHVAEIDVIVEGPNSARDAQFDVLMQAIGSALSADRTLGGLCDWIEGTAPAPIELADEGADTMKAATIPVAIHFDTQSELG